MTTEAARRQAAEGEKINNSKDRRVSSAKNHDRRVTGYTRVKSGEHKRRSVTRTPDMSHPTGRVANPNVAIGAVPAVRRAVPVASVHIEPTIHTVTSTKKVSFPYAVVFLSVICAMLFAYMILNFVQINEQTSVVADLRSDITALKSEEATLASRLEEKIDLSYIEKLAKEEYGMVKLEDITREYIDIDSGDLVTELNG